MPMRLKSIHPYRMPRINIWYFYLHVPETSSTLPKTEMDTQNDGLEKVSPSKHKQFLVSILHFWGVNVGKYTIYIYSFMLYIEPIGLRPTKTHGSFHGIRLQCPCQSCRAPRVLRWKKKHLRHERCGGSVAWVKRNQKTAVQRVTY